MTRCSLKPHSHINQSMYGWFVIISLCKLIRNRKSLFDSHFQVIRHKLCDGINLRIRHCQSSADISYSTSRRHCSECNYLCHMVRAIFSYDIIYNFLSPVFTEIHIKIRHTYSFWVKKSLKEQIIFNWVYSCNSYAICRKTSCT